MTSLIVVEEHAASGSVVPKVAANDGGRVRSTLLVLTLSPDTSASDTVAPLVIPAVSSSVPSVDNSEVAPNVCSLRSSIRSPNSSSVPVGLAFRYEMARKAAVSTPSDTAAAVSSPSPPGCTLPPWWNSQCPPRYMTFR